MPKLASSIYDCLEEQRYYYDDDTNQGGICEEEGKFPVTDQSEPNTIIQHNFSYLFTPRQV